MRSSSITCQRIILQKLFPKQGFTSRYIVYWANCHHISPNGLMLVILTLWSCWVEMGIWKDRCKNNPPARRKSSGVVSHIRPNFSHLSKHISKDSVYKHKHTHTKWYLSECLTGRVASNNAVIETSCCSCSPLIVNNKRKTSRKRWVKRSSKTQMFVFTASVLPSRVNRWNHQPSDLHDPLAGGRAVLRLPVHRDCLLQRRRVLKLPETGIHQIMIRQCGGSFRTLSDGGGGDKIARVLPVHVHPGPRLLCDCPGL